jgi:RimJ/RimL family protein N-acetyltransferase
MAATLSIESINHALISVPVDYTIDNANWWIEQQLSGNCDLSLCCLRAEDPETGPFIGAISLAPHDSDTPSVLRQKTIPSSEGRDVDLGYYLHPDWRGKGIMQAALAAIVSWGRAYERVRTVVVRVLEENVASSKIIAGFAEFKRANGEADFLDWPEMKGGGRKRLFVFEWTV